MITTVIASRENGHAPNMGSYPLKYSTCVLNSTLISSWELPSPENLPLLRESLKRGKHNTVCVQLWAWSSCTHMMAHSHMFGKCMQWLICTEGHTLCVQHMRRLKEATLGATECVSVCVCVREREREVGCEPRLVCSILFTTN